MAPGSLRPGDPSQVGAYQIVGRLGDGGMGTVYLGEDEAGRRVAVKVIRPELSSEPEFRSRFRSEVRRARQVPPFCTAEVIDADADHPTPYLVVEYIDGRSLAEVIDEGGPLAGGKLHSVAVGVAAALVAIHDAGVVHRDLKPANILFALGTPKVIDFGIAKALDTSSDHTVPGQIVGTVAYMAPERFTAGPAASVGPPADVFAWGILMAFAATGTTPFAADCPMATAGRIASESPHLDGIPQPLRDVVALTLHKNPGDRPTAHALLELLLRAEPAGSAPGRHRLELHPEVRRAAAAVRRTAHHDGLADADVPAESAARIVAAKVAVNPPAGECPTTLTETRPDRGRWMRSRRAAALITLAAVAATAGATAMPLNRLTTMVRNGGGPPPAGSASDDARNRSDAESASRGGARGQCLLDGPIDVTPRDPRSFSCPTAAHALTSQSIRARFSLGTPDACAAIWTHVSDAHSYRITICRDDVSLELNQGRRVRTIAFAELEPPIAPQHWHRVDVDTPGSGIAVKIDGELVLNRIRTAPELSRANVILGLATDLDGHPASDGSSVSFADIHVTSAR